SAAVRMSQVRLEELIADDFREIGASGKYFDKSEVLKSLPSEEPTKICSSDYEIFSLTPELAQVLYQSWREDDDGVPVRKARRSSLWRQSGENWQMIFHQGTLL
ncbi:MAG: nuclear transport factor 2 family protein, partial [Bdellovibrionales bacterium]|nr:nuclear transport factor 2 family protein [Bdellovibrionales bacterium]